MKKKTNLKVVQQQDKDTEQPSQQRDKTISSDEKRAILKEFTDRIDQTLAEAAFQFSVDLYSSSGVWSEGPCLPEFVEKLHPWINHREDRINAILHEMSSEKDPRWKQLDDDHTMIVWQREETGYRLGILVGARLAGYSRDKVRQMAEYLVDTVR